MSILRRMSLMRSTKQSLNVSGASDVALKNMMGNSPTPICRNVASAWVTLQVVSLLIRLDHLPRYRPSQRAPHRDEEAPIGAPVP